VTRYQHSREHAERHRVAVANGDHYRGIILGIS